MKLETITGGTEFEEKSFVTLVVRNKLAEGIGLTTDLVEVTNVCGINNNRAEACRQSSKDKKQQTRRGKERKI